MTKRKMQVKRPSRPKNKFKKGESVWHVSYGWGDAVSGIVDHKDCTPVNFRKLGYMLNVRVADLHKDDRLAAKTQEPPKAPANLAEFYKNAKLPTVKGRIYFRKDDTLDFIELVDTPMDMPEHMLEGHTRLTVTGVVVDTAWSREIAKELEQMYECKVCGSRVHPQWGCVITDCPKNK